jgi:hypothetical protein
MSDILEQAHFQSCLKEAEYHNCGRYPAVAFTDSRKPGFIYIGDSRHYAGCIITGGKPEVCDDVLKGYHVIFACTAWAEEAGAGLINQMVHSGLIPNNLWVPAEY